VTPEEYERRPEVQAALKLVRTHRELKRAGGWATYANRLMEILSIPPEERKYEGGWEMPIEYSGITDEHMAVRTRAGLFDVSHMGEIEIAGRQGPDAMQVIRQHHPAIDHKRPAATDIPHHRAQHIDMPDQSVVRETLQQVDREEITATGNAVTAVIGQGSFLAMFCILVVSSKSGIIRRNSLRSLSPYFRYAYALRAFIAPYACCPVTIATYTR